MIEQNIKGRYKTRYETFRNQEAEWGKLSKKNTQVAQTFPAVLENLKDEKTDVSKEC